MTDSERDKPLSVAPERFPFDHVSDTVVTSAEQLAPDDHSEVAEYIREVAADVREHRHGRQDPRASDA